MALPKIDTPVYELTLPLSKKNIKYRPFLVREQKNLMMAIEANDRDTVERNIKQVLYNCTLTEEVDIDHLPVLDIEYYFLQLRAKSVGELVDNQYVCNNVLEGEVCGNKMTATLNLSELEVSFDDNFSNEITISNNIVIKLKYPEFSVLDKIKQKDSSVEIAFEMISESIEYIFDGSQYYYANETSPQELMEFVESLSAEQFSKIEQFFDNLPKLNKKIEMVCSKCGFSHTIFVEGLENFFG